MEWLTQSRIRNVLLAITLGMTAVFGWELAEDFTGFMFAVTLVAFQAAALLHLPAMVKDAKQRESDIELLLYGGSIALAILVSITASVATLSSAEDAALRDIRKHSTLEQAIDVYLTEGYATRAREAQAELDSLPVILPTGLQSTALRIEAITGIDGMKIISVFIVLIALMLDGFVLILGSNHQSHSVTITETRPEQDYSTLEQSSFAFDDSQKRYDVSVERKPGWPPEVHIVIRAHQSGELPKLTVSQIRDFLGCAQSKAQVVARICKEEALA